MTFAGSTVPQASAPQTNGFEANTGAQIFSVEDPSAASPASGVDPADDIVERRLKRKLSNRESARRSRARKQRNLDDLRALAARLRGDRDELAARAHAARGRVALVQLANAELRAEAANLHRRLEVAAPLAVALSQLYNAAAAGLGTFDQMIFSPPCMYA